MNRHKTTKSLSVQDVKQGLQACNQAEALHLPLNVFITVRPINVDDMSSSERRREFARIRNLYDQYARRHRFTPAYVYTRECEPSGQKEHMHLLCHLPRKLRRPFMQLARSWLSEPSEIDVRPASCREYWTMDGKIKSAHHYMFKQMSPQAQYGRPYIRQRGGSITYKRWGCSHNLRVWVEDHSQSGARVTRSKRKLYVVKSLNAQSL